METTRHEVYAAIDTERDYQNRKELEQGWQTKKKLVNGLF